MTDQHNQQASNPEFIGFSPKFVADALGITPGYVRRLEDELDLDIDRVLRGSVEVRTYTPKKMFEIQGKRRERGQIKGLGRPLTISVYVKKGGTAKTSLTVNLAIQLQLQGLKVLVIDNDPQADCTTMFGYDPDRTPEELAEDSIPADRAVYGHMANLLGLPNSRIEQLTLEQVIKMPYGEHGPHLIPAEESLEDLSIPLAAMMHSDLRYGIFIEKARSGQVPHCDFSGYDVIIFDNNPAGTPLSRNAMVACDMMICPVRFDKFSFRALTRLSSMLDEFAEATGRSPEVVAVPTMFVRQRPRMQRNLARMSELFPDNVTQEQIPSSEDYLKSLEEGVPLSFYKSASNANLDALRALASEIIERMRMMTGRKA